MLLPLAVMSSPATLPGVEQKHYGDWTVSWDTTSYWYCLPGSRLIGLGHSRRRSLAFHSAGLIVCSFYFPMAPMLAEEWLWAQRISAQKASTDKGEAEKEMTKTFLHSSSSSPTDGGRDPSLGYPQPNCGSLLLCPICLTSWHKVRNISLYGGTKDKREIGSWKTTLQDLRMSKLFGRLYSSATSQFGEVNLTEFLFRTSFGYSES